MTVTEIREAFEKEGLTFTDEEVQEKLAASNMSADEVDTDLVTVWAEDIHQRQNKPAPKGKGKTAGLAKSEPAQPLAPQVPQQPQQQVNFQPITSTIHTTVEQLVRSNHQGEQEAIAAVTGYLKGTPTRIVDGVSRELAAIDMTGPLDSFLQQQQSAWASTNNSIADLIRNVNASAGVKNAA
jgi:hypothetical protein